MFKANTKFRSTELKYKNITNFILGLHDSWDDYNLPNSTLEYLENMDYNENGWLIARKILSFAWIYSSDSNYTYPSTTIWKMSWYYFVTKWDWIYKINLQLNTIRSKVSGITLPTIYSSTSINDESRIKSIPARTLKDTSDSNYPFSSMTDRSITISWSLIKNSLIWKYIVVWTEKRYITANTSDTIYIYWIFDWTYTTYDTVYIYSAIDCLLLLWYWIVFYNDWWYKTKNTTTLSSYFAEIYKNMLFYSDLNFKLYFTELWIVDYTPKNNFIEFTSRIKQVKSLWDRLVIFMENDIAILYWDNKSNFTIKYKHTQNILEKHNSPWVSNNMLIYKSTYWLFIETWNIEIWHKNPIDINIRSIYSEYNSSWWNSYSWAIYDNKYYYIIWKKILVYDIEKSKLFWRNLFTIYSLEDNNSTELDSITKDKAILLQVIDWRLFMSINWKWWIFSTKYPAINYISYIIVSNQLDFWDVFREKIFRRMKISFKKEKSQFIPTKEDIYTLNIYLSQDDWDFVLYKTTNKIENELFLNIRAKSIKYKIEVTWIQWSWDRVPLELEQINVGFSLLNKS